MERGVLADAAYMVDAIDQAIYGLNENPGYGGQVGCLIVGKDGNVISRAYNREIDGRRLHAEEIALRDAGDADLYEATMYLTMEPCNGNIYHSRRHCCEQIADAGIGRVVIANRKLKYEGGLDYLQKNGVETGVLKNGTINQLCGLITHSLKDGKATEKRIKSLHNVRSALKPIH